MNLSYFFNTKRNACNARCKVCKKTGMNPNLLGKFIVVKNDYTKVICTGCQTIIDTKELKL